MLAVNGTYENGIVRLDRKVQSSKTMKVIVTFLDEEVQSESKRLTAKDFTFSKAREKSKAYKGSISDAILEDRKSAQ